MSVRVVKAASAVAILLTAACGSAYGPKNDSVVCTTEARAAVSLTVVDSLTGQGTGLTGLFARVVDGTFRDSTTSFFTNPSTGIPGAGLAYERKGTYTVTVRATGYQDWTKTGVNVTADECHVTGVALTARLVK
jgi:hypothetical protein